MERRPRAFFFYGIKVKRLLVAPLSVQGSCHIDKGLA